MILSLKLFNTYSDEPIVSRSEIFDNLVRKQSKISKITWPGHDNLDQYAWIDDEGNWHLKSIEDDMCEIIISPNCLHFRIIYL